MFSNHSPKTGLYPFSLESNDVWAGVVKVVLKSFSLGIAFLLVFCIAALVVGDVQVVVNGSGGLGLVCFLVSALFSGALVSGDRMRANYGVEQEEDTKERMNWALVFFFIGLPNIAASAAIIIWG